MKPAVISIFPTFTKRLEGHVSHMYLDMKGLVTTGLGCLIDPVGLALPLPWQHRYEKRPATKTEIAAEWNLVKSRQDLAKYHYSRIGKMCSLDLTADGIDQLATARLNLFEGILKSKLPRWDNWPADAQLATMSMAWAMGAGFTRTFTNWLASARAGNWEACAAECEINAHGNPGIVPRNKANQALFRAAAKTNTPDFVTLAATGL
jgi:GH24 family phage-related lysozyme (muramidase)